MPGTRIASVTGLSLEGVRAPLSADERRLLHARLLVTVFAVAEGAAGDQLLAELQREDPAPGPASDEREGVLMSVFTRFLMRPLDDHVNVFQSNLALFAPKVDHGGIPAVRDMPKPSSPLELYSVDSFRLTLIMSGRSVSKALVIDPTGRSYVVEVGSNIGNKGGRVAAIMRNQVRIDQPGLPPVVMELESPEADVQTQGKAFQEF